MKAVAPGSASVRNPHVDRLRGCAALMVVMSHAMSYVPLPFWGLPISLRYSIKVNGYGGVSIFFAISGFLITRQILANSDASGAFSLAHFYRRRIARILPPLLLMIGSACLVSLMLPERFPLDWRSLPERLWFIFTFRYNLYFPSAGAAPRLWDPLWSLSVEEMFYLCFPALLLLLRKRALQIAALLAVVAAGPAYRILSNSVYAYLSNTDAIALGVLAAFAVARFRPAAASASHLRLLRLVGALIIVANFLYTRSAYGGPAASLAWGTSVMGLGTAIHLLGTGHAEVSHPIRFGWLGRFGQYSYEVYLFHMLVLMLLADLFKLPSPLTDNLIHIALGTLWMIAIAGLLLLISHLIHRFYSEPLRRWLMRVGRGASSEQPAHSPGW